jgi:exopolyphosphatase/guanosine-5'-triphosphate,3'-diphosphate pyrophosphatase
MLRLGDAVTRTGGIPPDDAERVLDTLRRFAGMAASAGAEEIVACGTSALREAENSAEIVDRILEETGIVVEVISGRREARLIFSAVRESVDLSHGPAVCFDLGGGSLEIMVGDHDGLLWSTSLHLGVARLAAQFVDADPPTPHALHRLRAYLTDELAPVAAEIRSLAPRLMVGTSGTFTDLASMAAALDGRSVPTSVNQLRASRADLQRVHERIVELPAAARAKLPGVDARRADQIPMGSTVLLTAMEVFGFDSLVVGDWALREGIVLEAIRRHDIADWTGDAEAVRRASVLGLARRCNWDEGHARQVARLAVDLFDRTAELHHLDGYDRELLEHAALLHDIGEHVAVEAHHKHTAYLIEHGKLRGFSPDDVAVLATLGRYHRRSDPKPSFEPFGRLPAPRRADVVKLLALLRLADGLDRGHAAAVEDVEVDVTPSSVRLLVTATADVDVEVWGLRRKRDLFEKAFDRRLEVVAADHPSVAGGS